MPGDDAALMACHADALFVANEGGDLLRVNDIGGPPAPAVYWGIARGAGFVRFRAGLAPAIRGLVGEILRDATDAWRAPEAAVEQVAGRVAAYGLRMSALWSGPVAAFPEVLPRAHEPVLVTQENAALLEAEFPGQAALAAARQPVLAVVRDGRAVALCCTARAGRCCDAGVDTAPGYRRLGLGAAVCAAWALAVRDLGRIPLYSTAWENTASRGLARSLGLRWIGVDVHFDLLPSS